MALLSPLEGGYSCTSPQVWIYHRPLPPLDTCVIEGCAVTVEADGSELLLVSMYLWPGLGTVSLPEECYPLLNHLLSTIVAGNLNAKHPT